MSDLSAESAQPDQGALLGEAYRRGILPPQQRGLYEEGLRRGLFKAPPGVTPAAPAAEAATSGAPTPDLRDQMGSAIKETGTALAGGPGKLKAAQESFASRMKLEQEKRRAKEGYEPGVDYDSGTNFTDAVGLMRADNPAEKRAFLESRYPPESIFQDKRGGFFIQTPEGKRVSPEGTGFVRGFLANLYADAPQIAGGTGGAIAGGALGGPFGAIGGAALGTMGGKAMTEVPKVLTGQQRKTLPESLGALGEAGFYGAAGEGAGRLVSGLPAAAGRLFRNRITGTTPEMRDLAGSVERAGGVAPLRSVTPGLSSPIFTQDVATKLGADYLEAPNRAAVQGRLRDIVESALPPAQRQQAMAEILDPTARVSAREAGEPLVGRIRQEAGIMEREIATLGADADRQLNAQMSRLDALSRRSPAGALGEDVAAGISQSRADFGTSMQKIYSRVDDLTGGQPIVPTGRVKREATRILRDLPKDAQGTPIFGDPRVLRALQQLQGVEGKITLGDAQRIRSTLGEFGEFTDLTPGVAKRQFDDLRQAADVAIGQAALDPAAAPAVNLLRQADKLYSDGIRKFEDAAINRIVAQARTGIMPDPGKVADMILQPRFTQRARQIRQMVGPDVWKRVGAADWDNMMAAARDPQTGEVSARKLATMVNARDRNGLLDLTYGTGVAKDIRLFSKRLDARGGKIEAADLTPDNFAATVGRLEQATAERDAFLKTNFLSALAKPGEQAADDAVSFVLRPGGEARLMAAQRHFGDSSPQMAAIREQALKELLNSAIVKTTTGAGTTVEGEGIEKALRQFTPRQQQILFPGGLADDMRRLASEIRFMFPARLDQTAGGLAAGAIKALPLPLRVLPVAYYSGLSWIYSQPSVVRALANGLKPGPGQAATRESVRMIFRAAAQGMLDNEDDGTIVPAAPVQAAPQTAAPVAPVAPRPAISAPDNGDIEPPPATRPPQRHSIGGP